MTKSLVLRGLDFDQIFTTGQSHLAARWKTIRNLGRQVWAKKILFDYGVGNHPRNDFGFRFGRAADPASIKSLYQKKNRAVKILER
jgi:hypothetical protein